MLGGGSNLVVADAGLAGVVVHVATGGLHEEPFSETHTRVTVDAGFTWDAFVERCVRGGLSGLEALSWIPGTVGATPIQNVGAFDQEVRQRIDTVHLYDRYTGTRRNLRGSECDFTYRSSLFRINPGRYLILSVTFVLERSPTSQPITHEKLALALGVATGQRVPLSRVRDVVGSLRRSSGTVLDEDDHDTWSAGSFFKNPVCNVGELMSLRRRVRQLAGDGVSVEREGELYKVHAAKLIGKAGFEPGHGLHAGAGVTLSSRHTLVLTNRGWGTTDELMALAHEIADRVERRFGVSLEPEPMFAGVRWGDRASREAALRASSALRPS